MARGSNPYAGQYGPSVMGMGREDLIKGLKGIKIKAPNKHLTTAQYKSGLKKEPEGGSN